MKPSVSAIPFRMAPMPCSRMPKWKLRPANAPRWIAGESAMRVRVEGSRSALPPASDGTSSAAAFSTTLPCARVAPAARGGRQLICAQRLAVRFARILLLRRAVCDVAAGDHKARTLALSHCALDRGRERGAVVRVGTVNLPAVGLEAPRDVLVERERRVALDRDVVVVVEIDQVPEPPVTGERSG